MIRYALVLPLFICALRCGAAENEMRTWKSKSGHSTRAQFHHLNESAGTITLLIPRTIRLDQLDPESVALARRFAANSKNADASSRSRKSENVDEHPLSNPKTRSPTNKKSFVGQTRYIHGIIVWGVGDFRWYDPSFELPEDPAKVKILMKGYGVEKLPNDAAVTLVDRRPHPVSGTWVYQVRHNGSLYWVLSDELRESL